MIKLPQVTLAIMTGENYKVEEHCAAINKSCEKIEFGDVKWIVDKNIKDIDTWNHAVIYKLPRYIQTSHCMFIHNDGYIINPHLWNNEWVELDFIGAPFPLPTDSYSYRDEEGEIQRVGNSVSLRSKNLLDLIATREWKYYYGNCHEDGFITCHNRKWLESQGCKFATLEQAIHFSKEHEIPENVGLETFAFHHVD